MAESDPEAVEQILDAERAWTQAHLDLDLATLEHMMAPNYLHLAPDGSLVDREAALISYRSGQRHWELAISDQHMIQVFGDMALLIGRWRARGVNQQVHFDYAARFVCFYVRQDGVWKVLFDTSQELD